MLGAYAPDSVLKLWDKALKSRSECVPCFPNYWAAHRDTAQLARAQRQADSSLKADQTLPPGLRLYGEKLFEAYMTLARGDSSGALRAIQALPDSLCYACGVTEITEAQLLEGAHRDREALTAVSVAGPNMDYYAIMLTLERGRIAERLGEKEIAVDSYARVATYWQNGDAFLQPYVKEARTALGRLGGERAKGFPIGGVPSSR
jgi:hypothetical protein